MLLLASATCTPTTNVVTTLCLSVSDYIILGGSIIYHALVRPEIAGRLIS